MLLMLVKPHNTNLNPRLNSIHNAPREGRQTTSFLIRTTSPHLFIRILIPECCILNLMLYKI